MTDKSRHRLFLELYSKSQARLYSFILMLVRNIHDADEIFQETSALLWEKFDEYDEGTNFGAWSVSVAKYKVFEHLRKTKKNQYSSLQSFANEIADAADEESSQIYKRLEALSGCLIKLDRISRSLLVQRYQRNIPVAEMARRKEVTVGMMYRRLSKIFSNLRRCVNLTLSQ